MKILSILWACTAIVSAGLIEGEEENAALLPKPTKSEGDVQSLGHSLPREGTDHKAEEKLLGELRYINDDDNLGRETSKRRCCLF
jgi:hypothetical protein